MTEHRDSDDALARGAAARYRAAASALDERASDATRSAILAAAARGAGARPRAADSPAAKPVRRSMGWRVPFAAAATVLLSTIVGLIALHIDEAQQVLSEADVSAPTTASSPPPATAPASPRAAAPASASPDAAGRASPTPGSAAPASASPDAAGRVSPTPGSAAPPSASPDAAGRVATDRRAKEPVPSRAKETAERKETAPTASDGFRPRQESVPPAAPKQERAPAREQERPNGAGFVADPAPRAAAPPAAGAVTSPPAASSPQRAIAPAEPARIAPPAGAPAAPQMAPAPGSPAVADSAPVARGAAASDAAARRAPGALAGAGARDAAATREERIRQRELLEKAHRADTASRDAAPRDEVARMESDPPRWLEHIVWLRRQGLDAEADAELERFRARHPQVAVPAAASARGAP